MNSTSTDKPPLKVKKLPPWKVILHNDNVNTAEYIVNKVQDIAKLKEQHAELVVLEAHKTGFALLLSTHKEKAELLVEQFASCKIKVTMELA